MIKIIDTNGDVESLLKEYSAGSLEEEILNIMNSSEQLYQYDNINQLKFELMLRNSIVRAAKDLANSRFEFETFKKARCNEEYWNLTENGGFLQKRTVKSVDAIMDIYNNSSKYGTECATAIVIVFFKALADILPPKLFLELFPNIYLYSWKDLDSDLGIRVYDDSIDYIPGDCLYFNNPDYDLKKPEWQGENVIFLGKSLYYGHGIGIGSGDKIIRKLNSQRKKDSQTSAYLMKIVCRPNFKVLAKRYYSYKEVIA